MQKSEFEAKVGTQVSNEDYQDIEYVYMWHPAISNVGGKEQIALLYMNFGLAFIRTMLPAARKMYELKDRLRIAEKEVIKIQKEIEDAHILWLGEGERNGTD